MSNNYATSVGLPQQRGRTLFFGARVDIGITAAVLVSNFQGFFQHCDRTIYHMDTFINSTETAASDTFSEASCSSTMFKHAEYCQELAKSVEKAKALVQYVGAQDSGLVPQDVLASPPEMHITAQVPHLDAHILHHFKGRGLVSSDRDLHLGDEPTRPSRYVPTALPAVRARVDVTAAIIMAGPNGKDTLEATLLDTSQSIERTPWRSTGLVPTLTLSLIHI